MVGTSQRVLLLCGISCVTCLRARARFASWLIPVVYWRRLHLVLCRRSLLDSLMVAHMLLDAVPCCDANLMLATVSNAWVGRRRHRLCLEYGCACDADPQLLALTRPPVADCDHRLASSCSLDAGCALCGLVAMRQGAECLPGERSEGSTED